MNRTAETSFADAELVELFADEPELLAIADAIAATTTTPARAHASASAPSRLRLPRPSVLTAVALVAAAAVVVLVAPWQRSHGTLTDMALAAIGTQPVVHVVMETPTGAGLVDIASGNAQPVMQRDEVWYDAARGLRRDVTRDGSVILDDELETPQGGFTSHGIVYDCAWIAAHPVAATKARVSCNASGDNGTTPHTVPRPKPTLDPGLAGFADSYRQALASGQAHESRHRGGQRADSRLARVSDQRRQHRESRPRPLLAQADPPRRSTLEHPDRQHRNDPVRRLQLRAADTGRGPRAALAHQRRRRRRRRIEWRGDRGRLPKRTLGRLPGRRVAARPRRAAIAERLVLRWHPEADRPRARARLRHARQARQDRSNAAVHPDPGRHRLRHSRPWRASSTAGSRPSAACTPIHSRVRGAQATRWESAPP